MTALGFSGGQVIVWCIVVGLAGYVLWRGVQAVIDPQHKGTDAKA